MIEVKTAELQGPALDWAVLAAMEVNGNQSYWKSQILERPQSYTYRPSTDWSQCGPLIAKYRPDLQTTTTGEIVAYLNNDVNDPGPLIEGRGKDYLIAACRVVVQFELGDTVQVPQELLS